MRIQARPVAAVLLALVVVVGGPCPRLLAGTLGMAGAAPEPGVEAKAPACPHCRQDAGLPPPEAPDDDGGCPCNLRGNPGYALMAESDASPELPLPATPSLIVGEAWRLPAQRPGQERAPEAPPEPQPDPGLGTVVLLL